MRPPVGPILRKCNPDMTAGEIDNKSHAIKCTALSFYMGGRPGLQFPDCRGNASPDAPALREDGDPSRCPGLASLGKRRKKRYAASMKRPAAFLIAAFLIFFGARGAAQVSGALLPNAWHISAPNGIVRSIGTLPQGLTLSPNGSKLAFIESGVAPAAVRVVDAKTLADVANVSLPGAFGRPAWDPDSNG